MTAKAKSKVPPHAFVADADLPPDHLGRHVCAVPGCRLVGEPGDAHHQLPEVPEQAQIRHRYDADE